MPKLLLSLIFVACTLLTGCAGTAARVQSDYRLAQGEKVKLLLTAPPTATEQGLQILRDRLTMQLSNNGLLAPTSDASARTLEVVVTNYSLRHGAARAMLGILAGTDNLQSTVTIKDQTTGNTLSEFVVESKNPSAWGTSRGLIEEHADKIVETLKGGKR
jgi:Domain of unknown function (DUF4410)